MPYNPNDHLVRLRDGKQYLPVAHRVAWMRSEHPDWGVDTRIEVLDVDNGVAVFSATITDGSGRQVAKATAMELKSSFPKFVMKAETAAIGRALALAGYGTQFAPEMDDDGADEPVDAPQERRTRAHASGANAGDAVTLACRDCGTVLTKGQHDFSEARYGRPLCPSCQRTAQPKE